MIRIFFVALLILVFVPTQSNADTFAIDLVIGAPAQDGFVQIAVGPRQTMYIPVSAFPADGKLSFDAEFEYNKHQGADIPGAMTKDQLRQKITELFNHVNRAFAPANVSFRLRSITFIDPAKVGLGPRINADGADLNLGITDDRSDLLDRFKRLTGSDRSAFKMLMVPITDEASNEQGRADEPGRHSVVDLGNAFRALDRGFLVAHELGHNFGLDHVEGSPFEHFMVETLPSRPPGPNRNRACNNAIGSDNCRKIGEIINNYRSQRWVEERGQGGGDSATEQEAEGNEEE